MSNSFDSKKVFTVKEINKLNKQNEVGFEMNGDTSTFYTADSFEIVGKTVMVNCSYLDSSVKASECRILVLKSNGWRPIRVKK